MKKETLEKKKASRGLLLAYMLMGIVVLAVIIYVIIWWNYEFPKMIQLHFTF